MIDRLSRLVFASGLAISLFLSICLIAALGSFGVQPGPLIYHIIAATLILVPIVCLIAKVFFKSGRVFNYVAGAMMIVSTCGYLTAMMIFNP